uniref:Thioredoxin n=2 Tax=unclassified Prevotella TaxID=2638335 RepID=A0AB33JNU8_9BACT
MKGISMKRRNVLAVIVAALVFASCNRTAQSAKQEKQQVEANKTSEKAVQTITSQDFKMKIMDYEKETQWKFKGDKPAIVDFYATWCGPCKIMSPILEQLAGKYKGRIDVYQIDIDKEREVAMQFGIQSIPAFLMIPKSGRPQMIVGAHDQAEFEQIIKENLLK